MRIDLNPNETVVKATGGKHYHANGTVPGKIILTNQRLLFTSEGDTSIMVSIVPSSIREILPFSKGFLTKKGVQVVLKDGREICFTMGDSAKWTELLNKIY